MVNGHQYTVYNLKKSMSFFGKRLTLIFFCDTVNNALLCKSMPKRGNYAQKREKTAQADLNDIFI